jgi:hypothetical protein
MEEGRQFRESDEPDKNQIETAGPILTALLPGNAKR